MGAKESLEKPLIISVGITGSVTTRAQLPSLPVTPTEIAESAVGAAEAGAAAVHIHVRESDGTPSARAELYEETFDIIRRRSDVLICATTGSGAGSFDHDQRLSALPFETDLASLDAGSMNFGDRVFENSFPFLRRLAREITSRGIVPEIECFDLGMIENARHLAAEGLLPGPGGKWWFQFCLGIKGGAPCDATTVLAMRALIPIGAEWSVLGVGQGQLAVGLIALVEGGHVRTGVEDNVYFRRGERVQSNAQLVARMVQLAGEVGRPIASPAQARELLGCRSRLPTSEAAVGASDASQRN